jgi:hypothetical protein
MLWNRGYLKAVRLASLLAVADNPEQPVIGVHHVAWARNLVLVTVRILSTRMESGDVGDGDDTRMRKLKDVVRDYFTRPVPSSYGETTKLKEAGIIPRQYLQIRTQQLAVFRNQRFGATKALDETLISAMKCGVLVEVPKEKMGTLGYAGQGFWVGSN